MRASERFEGVATPLDRDNVDTDVRVPKRWRVTVERQGLGAACCASSRPGSRLAVDLRRREVTDPAGGVHTFEIHPGRREVLLRGLDEIAQVLTLSDTIADFQRRDLARHPWHHLPHPAPRPLSSR